MVLIRASRLEEANDYLQLNMSRAEFSGQIDDSEFCQNIARTALILHVPELLGIVGRSAEVETERCEAANDEGVTIFEGVTYRGAYHGALVVKRQEQGLVSGNVLTSYGFTALSVPAFDGSSEPLIKQSAQVFADFDKIDFIKLKAA